MAKLNYSIKKFKNRNKRLSKNKNLYKNIGGRPPKVEPKPSGINLVKTIHLSVSCAEFHPTDELLAYASGTTVSLWNFSNDIITNFANSHNNDITTLAFHPNRRGFLATGDREGIIKLLVNKFDSDYQDTTVRRKEKPLWGYDYTYTFAKKEVYDRSYVAINRFDFIAIGAYNTLHLIKLFREPDLSNVIQYERTTVTSVTFFKPLVIREEILAVTLNSGDIILYRIDKRNWNFIEVSKEKTGRGGRIVVAFDNDVNLIATAEAGQELKLWSFQDDGTNMMRVMNLIDNLDGIMNLSFHPTEPLLTTVDSENTLKFWRMQKKIQSDNNYSSATCLANLNIGSDVRTWFLKFHPSKPFMITTHENEVKLWDIKSLYIVPATVVEPETLDRHYWNNRTNIISYIVKQLNLKEEDSYGLIGIDGYSFKYFLMHDDTNRKSILEDLKKRKTLNISDEQINNIVDITKILIAKINWYKELLELKIGNEAECRKHALNLVNQGTLSLDDLKKKSNEEVIDILRNAEITYQQYLILRVKLQSSSAPIAHAGPDSLALSDGGPALAMSWLSQARQYCAQLTSRENTSFKTELYPDVLTKDNISITPDISFDNWMINKHIKQHNLLPGDTPHKTYIDGAYSEFGAIDENIQNLRSRGGINNIVSRDLHGNIGNSEAITYAYEYCKDVIHLKPQLDFIQSLWDATPADHDKWQMREILRDYITNSNRIQGLAINDGDSPKHQELLIMKKIFDMIPYTTSSFVTYRIYANLGEDIDLSSRKHSEWASKPRFVSSTLSKTNACQYAGAFSEEPNNPRLVKFIIPAGCKIIPVLNYTLWSRATDQLISQHSTSTEFEIILPQFSRLYLVPKNIHSCQFMDKCSSIKDGKVCNFAHYKRNYYTETGEQLSDSLSSLISSLDMGEWKLPYISGFRPVDIIKSSEENISIKKGVDSMNIKVRITPFEKPIPPQVFTEVVIPYEDPINLPRIMPLYPQVQPANWYDIHNKPISIHFTPPPVSNLFVVLPTIGTRHEIVSLQNGWYCKFQYVFERNSYSIEIFNPTLLGHDYTLVKPCAVFHQKGGEISTISSNINNLDDCNYLLNEIGLDDKIPLFDKINVILNFKNQLTKNKKVKINL